MKASDNFFSQTASSVLTSLIGSLFIPAEIKNKIKGTMPKKPSDFVPVLRFAVCSDIHLDGNDKQDAAVRLRELFSDMYSYSSLSSYKSFDALLVAGDFTSGGAEEEYQIFNKIVSESIKEETVLLTVLGNHEFINYRDEDATVGYKVYKKYISEQVDTDTVINGYHFIGVSYDDNGKTFKGKIDWLKERIDNAVSEAPSKPVFVFQHPHPFATVYGSINWGDTDLRKLLSKYPQVVDFSGHSHYAPSDPRSVWQGEFTAVGCGSLAAFMGNLNYIEGDKDAPGRSGGFRLCEVDKDGNMCMMLYDSEKRMFFPDSVYYFTDIADSSKRAYSWFRQKAADTAPLFSDSANISTEINENGESVISFPDAKGNYSAENYKISVKDKNGRCVFAKTVISDYVRADKNDVIVNIGRLEKGEYKIKISAFSPYAKKGGILEKNFRID